MKITGPCRPELIAPHAAAILSQASSMHRFTYIHFATPKSQRTLYTSSRISRPHVALRCEPFPKSLNSSQVTPSCSCTGRPRESRNPLRTVSHLFGS